MILDADAHPALADLLQIKEVDAIAIRPDFYCYGALVAGNNDDDGAFFAELRAQISGAV